MQTVNPCKRSTHANAHVTAHDATAYDATHVAAAHDDAARHVNAAAAWNRRSGPRCRKACKGRIRLQRRLVAIQRVHNPMRVLPLAWIN